MRPFKLAALLALSVAVPALPAFADAKEEPTISQSLTGAYLAARVAVNDRDTQSAVRHYRRALELDPGNEQLRQEAFLTYVANGDVEAAVELAKQIEIDDGTPGIIRLVLGIDRLRAKDTVSAAKDLDRPWNGALDRLMAGLIRAWAQSGNGDLDEALATIDGLNGPSWFELFVNYHGGLIALGGNRTDDAIVRLERAASNQGAIQSSPKTYPRIVQALAVAYARKDDFDQALQLMEEEDANRPTALTKQMVKQLRAKTVPTLDVASAQRGAAEVLLNIGDAIIRQGGFQFAGIYYQLAGALSPNDDVVSLTLGEYFDRSGALPRANDAFARVPGTSAYSRIARLERALNLDEMDKREEARTIMDRLVEEDPDDLVTTLSYGAVLARHEKFDEAAKVYEAALARIKDPKPFHWNLYYRLGIAYERTKQWPKAEVAFKKALELMPNEPRVLNYLGYSWVDMNMNLEEGLKMIETAVSIRPRDGYMVDSLGWAFYRLGRFEDAVRELERAVELRPADPTINDHLGDAYWRAGRKLEAVYQWNHALSLDPEDDKEQIIRDKVRNGLAPDIKDAAQDKPADPNKT